MQPIGGLVAVVFVSSLTPPPPPKTTAFQNLKAQPHRIFFFAGVVQGFLFVSLLGLVYTGLASLHVSVGLYHAYAMTFIVFTQFFAGFLLTTFPRYLSRPSPKQSDYMPIVWLINGGSVLLIVISFFSETLARFPMGLVFGGFCLLFKALWQMHTSSQVTAKKDTTWMLVAFGFGALSHVLFIVDAWFDTYRFALACGFYLYLFFIVLIVSQKMMPFFTSNAVVGYTVRKSRYFLEAVCVALVLKVACNTLNMNALIADVALFGIITYELLKWRLPFFKAPPILWVLFLSIWWAPVAFALFVIEDASLLLGTPIFLEKAPLHALALGYFTTVLVGFGTRVILGHSGRTPKADAYAITLFGLIQAMTLVRILAGIFPDMGYMHAILTATALWILIFGLWAKRYMKILCEK